MGKREAEDLEHTAGVRTGYHRLPTRYRGRVQLKTADGKAISEDTDQIVTAPLGAV